MMHFLYRLGRFLALRMPIKTCYKFAVCCADIYYLFARSDKINLEANLKVVLKTNDRKLIKKNIRNIFRNFAKYLADFFRFSEYSRDYILSQITIKGKENLDRALAEGKGVIAVSVHLGNWEFGAAAMPSLGYTFYTIALEHKNKKVNDFFMGQRAAVGVNIIPIGVQLRSCFQILKGNAILAIAADKDFTNHGTRIDFFGRPCVLPKGPAFFSLRTGAPIVPAFLIRNKDDRFDMIFEKPITSKTTANYKAEIKDIMKKYNSVLERYIKAFPDQWYAFKKVWD